MKDRLQQIKASVEGDLSVEMKDIPKTIDKLRDDIAYLISEIELLRSALECDNCVYCSDKRRLDWIEQHPKRFFWDYGTDLRRAIDAAMKESK